MTANPVEQPPAVAATPEDIARWMLERLTEHGRLDPGTAAREIAARFGEQWTYVAADGRLRIAKEVTKAFRSMTRRTVVWVNNDGGSWRWRQPGDGPLRRQDLGAAAQMGKPGAFGPRRLCMGTEEGNLPPFMTEADHERAQRAGRNAMAKLAAEKTGQPFRPEKQPKLEKPGKQPKPEKLAGLGVQVKGDGVFVPGWGGKRLGNLAGSHAELTDGTRPHRIGAALVTAPLSLGAGLLLGLTRKTKASVFVVFADGSVHERKLDGKTALGQAQRDAVRYNALAAAAAR